MTIDSIPSTPLEGVLKGKTLDGYALVTWSKDKGEGKTSPFGSGTIKVYWVGGTSGGKCAPRPPSNAPFIEVAMEAENFAAGRPTHTLALGQMSGMTEDYRFKAALSDATGAAIASEPTLGYAIQMNKHDDPKGADAEGHASFKLVAVLRPTPGEPSSWISGAYDGPLCWAPPH
jgi:hypothetical protein